MTGLEVDLAGAINYNNPDSALLDGFNTGDSKIPKRYQRRQAICRETLASRILVTRVSIG